MLHFAGLRLQVAVENHATNMAALDTLSVERYFALVKVLAPDESAEGFLTGVRRGLLRKAFLRRLEIVPPSKRKPEVAEPFWAAEDVIQPGDVPTVGGCLSAAIAILRRLLS
jgi:hypothetical protein